MLQTKPYSKKRARTLWRFKLHSLAYSFLCPFSLVISTTQNICQEKSFRRQLLIAYNVSAPFVQAEKSCPEYQQALTNLFSNSSVCLYNKAFQNNTNLKRKNGVTSIDTGTSGFYFAAGSSTNNIILIEEIRIKHVTNPERKFISSLLMFDARENFHPNGNELPVKIYENV